jgi:FlgD Ig-like domain/Galactose oxidase, central domain
MAFDFRRRVTWMFAGAPFGQAGNEMWIYDALKNTWTEVPKTSPWPAARRFAAMAYDSRRDVFLMWGGVTASDNLLGDTWLFHPSTRRWESVLPPDSPDGDHKYYSEDLDYDPVNDVFVLNRGGAFWLFRAPGPAGAQGGDPNPSAPAMRIASADPSAGGPILDFTLPRDADISVTIYDARGRRVDTIARGRYAAGTHTVRWSGHTGSQVAPSGVYVARLVTPGRVVVKRFTLLR